MFVLCNCICICSYVCMKQKFVITFLVLINDCDAANNSIMPFINPLTSKWCDISLFLHTCRQPKLIKTYIKCT